MTLNGKTTRPGPGGLSWRRDVPCRRCGGLGTHYLTCPLLRIPVDGQLPDEGEMPDESELSR